MVSCQAIARSELHNYAVLAKWVTIYGSRTYPWLPPCSLLSVHECRKSALSCSSI